MNVIKTEIPDVLIFEPKVFGDERGFFMESFNQRQFEEIVGRKISFVQDNHSKSKKVFYVAFIISCLHLHKVN